jgi:hypothetical protein
MKRLRNEIKKIMEDDNKEDKVEKNNMKYRTQRLKRIKTYRYR